MTATPLEYARRQGDDHLLQHGVSNESYFTPPHIAALMARELLDTPYPPAIVLDPASGAGILLAALCELAATMQATSQFHIDAWEINHHLATATAQTLDHSQQWLNDRNIKMTYTITNKDFLADRGLLVNTRTYDAVIANPPYRKLSFKEAAATIDNNFTEGHPNAYTAFMAKSVQNLTPSGAATFLVPRSFTSGHTFQHVRKDLFRCTVPTSLHLFESRKELFKTQGVLQENIIITLAPREHTRIPGHTRITHIRENEKNSVLEAPTDTLLPSGHRNLPLPIPTNSADVHFLQAIRTLPGTLASLGLGASTGKVIIFRHTQHLTDGRDTGHTLPMMHMHQVTPMKVDHLKTQKGKPSHIHINASTRQLLIPPGQYVLVRRFSPKEQYPRIVAAPLFTPRDGEHPLAVENHLNYVHSPMVEMDPHLATGLAAYMNSHHAHHWAALHVGNTHIGATDLNTLPLPAREQLESIGRALGPFNTNPADTIIERINEAVNSVVTLP